MPIATEIEPIDTNQVLSMRLKDQSSFLSG